MESFTVIADAVTVRTGRISEQTRKPEVVRLLKGQQIEGERSHPSIATLLSAKTIRPTKDLTGKEAVTARSIFRVYKDDVTASVNDNAVPIAAPMPVTDPNLL